MTSFWCLAVSPDGATIAAQQLFSRRLSLFDAATMRPIGLPIPVSADPFEPIFTDAAGAVGAGSTRVLGLAVDGSITSWNLDPDAWQALACHAAGRNLTSDEWAEYIGVDAPYRATCDEWAAT